MTPTPEEKEAAFQRFETHLRCLAQGALELKALGVTESEIEARLGPVLEQLEHCFDRD